MFAIHTLGRKTEVDAWCFVFSNPSLISELWDRERLSPNHVNSTIGMIPETDF